MKHYVTLKTDLVSTLDWGSVEDLVILCDDGSVTSSRLLLSLTSPYLRTVLEERQEEEQVSLSWPGITKSTLSSFLRSLTVGGEDIVVDRDLRNILFPDTHKSQVKLEALSPSRGLKEEVEYASEVKDIFEDNEEHKDDIEDNYDDYEDPSSPLPEIPSDDCSSPDSEYEEPKKKKKKRKYNLNNLKQFQGANKATSSVFETKTPRGRFQCFVCVMGFRQEETLLKHVNRKHGPQPAPKCDICGKKFETYPKMQYHRKTLHSERIPCAVCSVIFPASAMGDHMRNKHDESDPQTCEFCAKVFTNPKMFRLHVRKHSQTEDQHNKSRNGYIEKYNQNCNCGLKFTNNKLLIKHYKIVHEGFQECPNCEKVVKDIDERAHRCEKLQPKKREDKSGTCPECGRFFEHAITLWYHMKVTHSKETSECEICGKVFKSYINKNDHVKRNHTEKPTCPICGKQVVNLKEHIGSVHTEESQKRFQCEHCAKGFVDNRKLREHMNIHLNMKPYQCREGCEMAYSDRSNRNQHERRVHGVRGGLARGRQDNIPT